MRRSLIRWKADPSLIVQKRLPGGVRKQQARQQLWQEDKAGPEKEHVRTPAIVVQIAQAAKRRQRSLRVWSNLLDQALENQDQMMPEDMASVLWSMADARYRHGRLLDEFIRSLSMGANVNAMTTAMLAVDRLGLPTEMLRAHFLQQITGQCEQLSFADLRRMLMALARTCQTAPVESDLLDELCDAIVAKAGEKEDPRDLITMPQHLGRLRHMHGDLLSLSASAVLALVSSRLAVLPLDALRACDGFLLLKPLVRGPVAEEQADALASKCRLLAAELLRRAPDEEFWGVGAQLLGAGVEETRVWSVWTGEALDRRGEGVPRAQCVAQVRKRIAKEWGVRHPSEGLERALRSCLQPR
mmetsp:Transcript_68993/g.180831  ORF Transcript_68993/g.180831 Transcript_68993/m.180831 type:complete len:357 (-) Transcript_68993:8-1078(-)